METNHINGDQCLAMVTNGYHWLPLSELVSNEGVNNGCHWLPMVIIVTSGYHRLPLVTTGYHR